MSSAHSSAAAGSSGTTDDLAAGEFEPKAPPLTPGARKRRGPLRGLPLESEGETWILACLPLAIDLDEARDEMFEELAITERIGTVDVFALGMLQLRANYQLAAAECGRIMAKADRERLVHVVVHNTMVHTEPDERRGYSCWARTGMIAAGLDPEKIHPEDVPGVLNHLIRTGRMAKLDDVTAAGEHAATRAGLVGMM